MAQIRWSRRCSLSWASLVFLLLVRGDRFMADNEANEPLAPILQADAVGLSPEERLQAWKDAYYGKQPPPATAPSCLCVDGVDGIWNPPGKKLVYIDRQIYFDGSEVGASGGFRISVPDGELWRLNWVAVDWVTNTGSSTRFFLIQIFDFLSTGFGYYIMDSQKPGDNSGGSVVWAPGVAASHPTAQLFQIPLPRPTFAYSTWTIQVQIGNAGTDFLNSLRMDVERWRIETAAAANGTNTNTPTIPPWFALGGPYWKMA